MSLPRRSTISSTPITFVPHFTNSGSNILIWNTINEINGIPLPEDDWQYHVSVNHTAVCENTEAIINRRNLGIYYYPDQAARTDVFIFEISQADAEEISTSTGKQRRFSITSAHGYAGSVVFKVISDTYH
jgi:hypothetical protein